MYPVTGIYVVRQERARLRHAPRVAVAPGLRVFDNVADDVPDPFGRLFTLFHGIADVLPDDIHAEVAELTPDLLQETIFSQNNEGLTFVWMPQLFGTLPFGRFFMFLFFLALSFAAITSLIAMIELATRALWDAGVELRGRLALRIGDAATSELRLRESLALYREIGATGHAERLAKELGL